MFVDNASVEVKAGNGGNGYVSFRHEKYIDRGGPDGGDGGDGGDVIFMASRNQDSLSSFRYKKRLQGEDGHDGFKKRSHGKSGLDLMVQVPVGTIITSDVDDQILADLAVDEQTAVIAGGGKGGFGNAHFISSTRQAPKVAEKGEAGQHLKVTLELKMLADAGLIGLPNAGKSTLLARISNAKPEIADYPFTTLSPNLGIVDIDNKSSLLVADIPGLIEGAAEGKGLGDEFLRHVERSMVLVHLIDAGSMDIIADFKIIQAELKAYKQDLTKRRQIVAITKTDSVSPQVLAEATAKLKTAVTAKTLVMPVSAVSGEGLKPLLYAIKETVNKEKLSRGRSKKPSLPVINLPVLEDSFNIEPVKNGFNVTGSKIGRFAARTNFGDEAGEQRLRDILQRLGVIKQLERSGIKHGQKINFPGQGSLVY